MILSVKVFISKILCSNTIGRIVAWIFNDKIPFYGTFIYTAHKQVSNRIKAMLFWKMYESSEVRFVQKYISDKYDVVELGSSIGAVSMQLAKKIKNRKLLTIEANPLLIDLILENLNKNGILNGVVIHAAYGCSMEDSWIEFGHENILGKIQISSESGDGAYVKTVSLKTILASQNIDDFVLVCDIEGAEIELLLVEPEALAKCKLLIIELHETSYKGTNYMPSKMKDMLLHRGFTVLDEHGVNLVMARNN
jgi:FkbM family methyltransferase